MHNARLKIVQSSNHYSADGAPAASGEFPHRACDDLGIEVAGLTGGVLWQGGFNGWQDRQGTPRARFCAHGNSGVAGCALRLQSCLRTDERDGQSDPWHQRDFAIRPVARFADPTAWNPSGLHGARVTRPQSAAYRPDWNNRDNRNDRNGRRSLFSSGRSPTRNVLIGNIGLEHALRRRRDGGIVIAGQYGGDVRDRLLNGSLTPDGEIQCDEKS